MRSMKIKFFFVIFILVIVYIILFDLFFENWSQPKSVIKTSVMLKFVLVHFDLKGSPPKLEYLESLLPKLVNLGANGLLMEYEDMFPYEGKLVNLSAKNCYDKTKLKKFLTKSVQSGLEIIPLVQTFGHMEHALKLQEFQHLREVSKYPDSICPSNPESTALIRDMLEQVIRFHTSITPLKYFHIGCDEVYTINKCTKCHSKKATDVHIFFNHVNDVNLIVKDLIPHSRVLMWDDMLRGKRGLELIDLNLSNIEPVYWDYKPGLAVSHANLFNYHKKFKNIWIASAFKGADGSTRIFPDFRNRLMNNLFWLYFIMKYKFAGESQVYNFEGIILTGWSRYNHMSPLCELLPVAMPSLILNLILIQTVKKGIDVNDFTDIDLFFGKYLEAEFNKHVKYEDLYSLSDLDQTKCMFEGSDIYTELQNLKEIHTRIDQRYSDDGAALYQVGYYYKYKNIGMIYAEKNIKWCKNHLKYLSNLEQSLKKFMSVYYDEAVIKEYVSYNTYKDKTRLSNTLKMLKRYMQMRSWQRKPL